jgi:PAS domain S-box-containing protein
MAVAECLAGHPLVAAVHYPGLKTHSGHALAAAQQDGFGAMLSFELKGGVDAVRRFVEAVRVFTLAESLGGVESLVAHPATMTHAGMGGEARRAAGISDSLVRLSVGIEAEADLIADLERGLAATAAATARRAHDMQGEPHEFIAQLARAILATSADAILATDRDGVIRFWNPGAARIFGFAEGEAVGASLDLIVPERLRQRHWEGFRHVMATGESRYGEGDLLSVPGVRKDGRRISLEFTIVPIKDQAGRMQGLAAVMRDVTGRFEEMRALKKKLAEATAPPSPRGQA